MQDGKTALMGAASMGHTETVKYLVQDAAADVNATDNVSHSNCIVY